MSDFDAVPKTASIMMVTGNENSERRRRIPIRIGRGRNEESKETLKS